MRIRGPRAPSARQTYARAPPWAESLEIGASVAIAGPPGAHAFSYTHAHYILAADPTALPAIARWLDEAPGVRANGVTADVVVEIDHADEADYPLTAHDRVKIRWVPRGSLAAEVMSVPIRSDDTFLFAAGEADSIRPLRAWSRNRLPASICGYWKHGTADADEA
ncbi:siderophore-interacting protein [Kribbella sp. NBC_00709]|uniref:siderophore-interacting protein n=1 Tax=Kribbella sp. NBC_00709 TaxID=2975972 RepID=UPI002E28AD40|nr:siderophore-interacting protein [Kribbella sp. NBC_00709]